MAKMPIRNKSNDNPYINWDLMKIKTLILMNLLIIKKYRSDAEQYRDRLLEIKKEIKEKNKKRCEQLKHL